MAVAGLVLGAVRAVRGPGRVRWTLAVVFPLVYFWFVSRQSLVFGRDLMPLVPFLCLLAATAVVSGVSLLRRFDIQRTARTALIAALTVAALLPPTLQAIAFNVNRSRTSTVEQAHHWIVANVPHGSRVLIESNLLLLAPQSYKAVNVPRLVKDVRSAGDYRRYVEQGFQYMVATAEGYGRSFAEPHRFGEEYAAYVALFEQSRERARFAPSADHPGPEIRIFALE
jgi:hypothetical protein